MKRKPKVQAKDLTTTVHRNGAVTVFYYKTPESSLPYRKETFAA